MLVPSYGGNSYSPFVAWSPQWEIGPRLWLRGSLGATLIRYNPTFVLFALEYSVQAQKQLLSHFAVHAGVGGQTWFSRSAIGPHFLAGVSLPFEALFSAGQDELFLEYAIYLPQLGATSGIRLGLRFGL